MSKPATVYIWPLTIWERVHGWLFASVLVIALFLCAVYLREYHLEMVALFLVPQILYPCLVLDKVYMVRTLKTSTLVATAWRVVSVCASILLNVVLFALILLLSFSAHKKLTAFRINETGAYATLLLLLAGMIAINIVQLISYYFGWPFETNARYKILKSALHVKTNHDDNRGC